MTFHEEVIMGLEQHGGSAVCADTPYRLGPTTYIGGMIDSTVEADAVRLAFSNDRELSGRTISGVLHSVEAPMTPGDPLRFHFIESDRGHTETARAVGLVAAYNVATELPVRGRSNAMMGALYYADAPQCAVVQLYFSEARKPGRTIVDGPTARSITAALMNTVGLSLAKRMPGVQEVTYFLSFEGPSAWQAIRRDQLEQGIAVGEGILSLI